MKQQIILQSYECGLGAGDAGTRDGPQAIAQHLGANISEAERFHPSMDLQGLDAIPILAEINTSLAQHTEALTLANRRFITLGGDHSCAIGTWSGVASALQRRKEHLGLIWFDAHMDSHTPATTPSNNIHGMPLACLLGEGDLLLTRILSANPKVQPANLCLIGVRSFESEEQALLERLKVRVFTMQDIEQRGLEAILQEALAIATAETTGFGISFDLDALDPNDAPGVGSPAPDGLRGAPLLKALKSWQNHPQLIGLEIAEYNPSLDIDNRTQLFAVNLINTIFGLE
ncbi:MAG: arginase [Pseudomonadota bacterium]|nr:arginase [Pseudomonadota bacterium]